MKMILVALTVGIFVTGGFIVWESYSLSQNDYGKTIKYDDYRPRGGINDHAGEESFPVLPSSIS